jgi:predicted CoA-substrate-specific enzyme activase
MIVAGCDVGSLSAKVVILKDGEWVNSAVIRCGINPEQSAQAAFEKALNGTNLKADDLSFVVTTGYGRKHISFGNHTESEITCHARGALKQMPSVRMLVDIGGQDAKAITFDERGNVSRYLYNDKCASGTGRFLEIIADTLEIKLEDLGPLSMRATHDLQLSNQCVIFAETEILSLVSEGKETPDIIKALHRSVARRAAAMARSIGLIDGIAMSGGVAINDGMFEALQEALGVVLVRLPHPQINGALGAAVIAAEMIESGRQQPDERKQHDVAS